MLFKELINRVNHEEVWNVLEREYDLNSKAYQAYKKVIEELRLLESSSSEIEVALVVAKVED